MAERQPGGSLTLDFRDDLDVLALQQPPRSQLWSGNKRIVAEEPLSHGKAKWSNGEERQAIAQGNTSSKQASSHLFAQQLADLAHRRRLARERRGDEVHVVAHREAEIGLVLLRHVRKIDLQVCGAAKRC